MLPVLQLTKDFNLMEFHCKDGTAVPNEMGVGLIELVQNLQILRNYLGVPLHIMSGFRSKSHNAKVGGADSSQHLVAKAADITCKSKTPIQVKNAILHLIKEGKMKNGGLGTYKTFIHYDVGPVRRWN